MKLVNAAQMRQIDAKTINVEKIPSPELMENAGYGIASSILSDILIDEDEARFTVICGKGNNGGDGFVIGRYLFQA